MPSNLGTKFQKLNIKNKSGHKSKPTIQIKVYKQKNYKNKINFLNYNQLMLQYLSKYTYKIVKT